MIMAYLIALTFLSPFFLILKQETIETNTKKNNKMTDIILEVLGAIVLVAAVIIRAVFHTPDFDIVFDESGKAVVIILLLLFFVIYYIQSKKMDKG